MVISTTLNYQKNNSKSLQKAHKNGKAMTLTMDPFQIQNHQHLRGSGNLKRTSRTHAKRLIEAATNRAIRAIGGNITATAKDSGKRLIVASTDRAIQGIEGSGINDIRQPFLGATNTALHAMTGSGSVNRLKKGQRWEQFANATIRDGIDTAGKAARVYYGNTGPMAQLGFGLRKRSPRKKRSESPPKRRSHGRGGALYPAGIP